MLLQLEHAFEKQSAKDGKPIQNHKIGSQSSTNTIWVKAKNKSINKSIKWRCVTCHNTWKVSTFTMNVYIYFLYIFPFRDCQHRQHLLYDEHLGNLRGKGLEGHSTFCISVCFYFLVSLFIFFSIWFLWGLLLILLKVWWHFLSHVGHENGPEVRKYNRSWSHLGVRPDRLSGRKKVFDNYFHMIQHSI